ncbi:sirohydrochlorin chelatase [Natronobacterium gregoryi]|uniref:Cobalamin (Vitamin B12) biosynthesis CbiX protein n=2 Tax=Natronobacterium gregoryi TaxID=44930 RepID=L0AE86_NATGS|nr:sirohydrochlorin chelatase [Natronobacterium gregoryi]AFZ71375.1 hypothetical protein Natgr_0110 [Natronobacterium gregoryi SP2]ELY66900.1 cobalamin (vitamin B12) biosynthesis CbiX protein [Natronobacterium gregoryi SP2]PLK21245.1 sirohydrochlorin chelatase [Natronobacterium gregoryi SP2]SFI85132.1 Sirohydrochlorin ferrochelatase [Natronobacterium gregoryi]
MSHDDEAVLVVGHGSRRERSNEQVRDIAADLESAIGVPVVAGFIEFAEPSLMDALSTLAAKASTITVVHCSLFAAGHVKNDVPLALNVARERYDVEIHNGSHIGVHRSILELLDDRIAAVERDRGIDREQATVEVVLTARGSSDPDANGDVFKLARMLYEGRSFGRVEPAFVGITDPRLETAVSERVVHDPDAIVVVPYMLGDGVLTQRLYGWVDELDEEHDDVAIGVSRPLGTDRRLVEVLADRYRQARRGGVDMSCDTCKYKVRLPGHEDEVGGEAALEHALEHLGGHEHDHGHQHDGGGHDHSHAHEGGT